MSLWSFILYAVFEANPKINIIDASLVARKNSFNSVDLTFPERKWKTGMKYDLEKFSYVSLREFFQLSDTSFTPYVFSKKIIFCLFPNLSRSNFHDNRNSFK